MHLEPLVIVPAVHGEIRTAKKTRKGIIAPTVFKEAERLFIGVTIEDDTIMIYGLMTPITEDSKVLRLLGTRTLRLMSAILKNGNALDAELVRECWIASDLHPHIGPNGNAARLENARDIVRHHLGQDVAMYLREQERLAS